MARFLVTLAAQSLEPISPRLLHRLFEGQERTFAQTVRTMRLEQCARLLADPLDRSTITDIALRHGFTDSASYPEALAQDLFVRPGDHCPLYWRAIGRPAVAARS